MSKIHQSVYTGIWQIVNDQDSSFNLSRDLANTINEQDVSLSVSKMHYFGHSSNLAKTSCEEDLLFRLQGSGKYFL